MTLNAVQTSYSTAIASGFEGMIASARLANIITRTIEDAAGVGFGKPLFRGTGDHGVTATPAANTFMGFSVATSDTQVTPAQTVADLRGQYSSVPLMDQGEMWVQASLAVADGDPVYVTPGKALTNVSNSSANFLLPAVWNDTTTGAGLSRIRIRQDDTA